MEIRKYNSQYMSLSQNFKCGNIVIDNFLKSSNALDDNQGITYVLLTDKEDFLIGYFNISVGRVDQIEIINDNKSYIPMGGAVNINYLAIDERLQHTKIVEDQEFYFGDYILRECEKVILKLRNDVGIAFVTLYSTNEGYHLYYDRNSYEKFENDMSTFVEERDTQCFKLYKWVDEIIQ